MWHDITPSEKANGECASKDCGARPVALFEHGGIGSYYCADCAQRIERMRLKSAEINREIDELERVFGAIETK